MAGTIVRIRCRNFLTYDSMEVFPKDKLNVIIGPNGTGKSTIACAIVLGLGGKPAVIGRSKQLSAYVQYGQNKSLVEIELCNPDGENYVIKRVFDTKNESKWNINGRQVTEQQVRTLVSKLNIQIDNLCQFLPQDRVQDFAKMNKQQLFYNTLKSIGGVEMETTLDKLKDLQKNFTSLKKTIESKTTSLNQETIDNQRLEGEVENSNERKKLVDHIDLMNKKRVWLQYENKCKDKEVLKKETDSIKKKYDKEKLSVKPMEDKLKEINQSIKTLQARIGPLNNTKQQNYSVLMKCKEQCARVRGDIDLVEDKLRHLGEEEGEIRKEVESTRLLLSVASNDIVCDEAQVTSQIREAGALVKQELEKANKVKSSRSSLEMRLESVQTELGRVEARLKKLQNVRHQRETLLSHLSEDALKATHWLRENKHLFQGEIYEPMLLELNIKKPEYTRQLESLISRDDLLAFTCEYAADAGVLLRELRETRRWKVNIVTMPDPEKRKSIKSQPLPLSQLRKFGFECYASDVIEAPEGVETYLYLSYGLTAIPLGGKHVTAHHYNSTIPKQFSTYFSDECMYTAFTSQYSGNFISSSNPLKKKVEYFNASADPEVLNQISNRMQELSTEKAEVTRQLTELAEELSRCERNYAARRQGYNEAKRKLEQKEAAERKVEYLKKKLGELQTSLSQQGGREAALKKQIQDTLSKLLTVSQKLPQYCAAVVASEEKVDLLKLMMNQERKKLERCEVEYSEGKEALQRIERAVAESEQRLNICKQETKRLYRDAMDATEGQSPSDEPLKSKFGMISSDLDALESRINKQKAELACLPEVNDSVFQEYEARQKKIASLQRNLSELSEELNKTEATIEAIKTTWLPQISEYIQQINVKYSAYFKEMDCAGEVSLHVPESEYDFENYGISIRVKFRGESDLKELDGHRQSGGERAVSTALYMLAMQGLTSVPFRLVDEINQGMDVINERKVFQLLLRIVDHSSTACQYFLITPKLLRDMEYSKDTNVICIYNGQEALSHDQFNVASFIDNLLAVRNTVAS